MRPTTLVDQFAAAIATPTALPDSTRRTVLMHTLDAIGAWIAGSTTGEGGALRQFAASALGQTAPDRIAIHCALTRLSEVDDIHLGSVVTPGAIVVPTALILAAETGADREHVLSAIAAGYEAMVRLGAALDGAMILYRGFWPTYLTAPFGAAATAARLLGLDETQTANALALALSLTAPALGQPRGPHTSRWLACGLAARSGVTAALAARAGYVADRGFLDPQVFATLYPLTPNGPKFLKGLGTGDAVAEVSFKPWCAARQTMAATQAFREILADGVALDDITGITALVPGLQMRMVAHEAQTGDRISHLTSLPHNLALAAVAPNSLYDVRRAPASRAAEIQALTAKVKVQADDSLMTHYPAAWPGRVVVRTGNTEREKTVLHIPGDPAHGFDEAQLLEKLRHIVAAATSPAVADTVLAQGRALLAGEDIVGAAAAALQSGGLAAGSGAPVGRTA